MTEGYWSRAMGRRLSRRDTIRGTALAGLGLAGAALVGCGGETEAEPSGGTPAAAAGTPAAGATGAPAVSGEPVSGGTFNTNLLPGFSYQHLDPHAAVWTANFTAWTHSQLVRMDVSSFEQSEWELVPDAAASWEEPDSTTYVFHLQENLNFHDMPPADGRAATSEDVKWMVEHISTKEAQFFRQHEFKDVTVETPDEKTVVFKLPQPQAAFWNRITTPGTVIMPPEYVEMEGAVLFKSGRPLAGTGPFMTNEFVQDQRFSVVRNPNYYKEGQPYLDEIVGISAANRDARWVAFKAKQIDTVSQQTITRDMYDEALTLPDITIDRRIPTQGYWVVFHTEKPPFGDARVRRALSFATPRQDIVDVGHRGLEDGQMLGPGGLTPDVHGAATYSYEELQTRPGYRTGADREADVAEARKLLDAAGVTDYRGRLPFTSGWPFSEAVSTLLQDAYREIGFEVELVPFPYSDTLVNLANRDFEMYWTPQHANGLDVNEFLEFYFLPDSVRNYGAWKSPGDKYSELVAQQNLAIDVEERNSIVREIVALLEEEVPRAPTNIWASRIVWHNYLHGWHGTYSSDFQTIADRVWKEK